MCERYGVRGPRIIDQRRMNRTKRRISRCFLQVVGLARRSFRADETTLELVKERRAHRANVPVTVQLSQDAFASFRCKSQRRKYGRNLEFNLEKK